MEKTLEEKNMQALNDRVLVRVVKPPTESAGTHGKKIILASGADQRQYNEGTVLSVGPKCTDQVQPGDVVTWEVFKGQAAGHFDETRWVIKESELLTKVTP
jgi:co-chaperonin GroES (HSP10)